MTEVEDLDQDRRLTLDVLCRRRRGRSYFAAIAIGFGILVLPAQPPISLALLTPILLFAGYMLLLNSLATEAVLLNATDEYMSVAECVGQPHVVAFEEILRVSLSGPLRIRSGLLQGSYVALVVVLPSPVPFLRRSLTVYTRPASEVIAGLQARLCPLSAPRQFSELVYSFGLTPILEPLMYDDRGVDGGY